MRSTCCLPLHGGVKLIAVVDMILALVLFATSVGLLIYFELFDQEVFELLKNLPGAVKTFVSLDHLGAAVIRVFLGFSIIYWMQKIVLGIILVIGVFHEKRTLLRTWIVYSLVLLVISVFVFLAVISMGVAEPVAIPFYVALFLLREYTIWVVYSILKRFQEGKESYPSYPSSRKIICKL